MFSTFFYILILFYQNLYSGFGYSFNIEVNKINVSILAKDYDSAFSLLELIEKKHIFRNESVNKTKVFLSIKRPNSFVNSNLKSSDDYVFKSLILSQTNHQERSKWILREGLKLYPEKDTLIKLYELFSFIDENKLNNLKIFNEEIMVRNKIAIPKDSKWMLDLLRKNEKFLSY